MVLRWSGLDVVRPAQPEDHVRHVRRDGEDVSDRTLHEVARDIREDWRKPYHGAVPYLDAMASLESVRDSYGLDSGDSIVRYFLANASTWRGEVARRVKAELKSMIR